MIMGSQRQLIKSHYYFFHSVFWKKYCSFVSSFKNGKPFKSAKFSLNWIKPMWHFLGCSEDIYEPNSHWHLQELGMRYFWGCESYSRSMVGAKTPGTLCTWRICGEKDCWAHLGLDVRIMILLWVLLGFVSPCKISSAQMFQLSMR